MKSYGSKNQSNLKDFSSDRNLEPIPEGARRLTHQEGAREPWKRASHALLVFTDNQLRPYYNRFQEALQQRARQEYQREIALL